MIALIDTTSSVRRACFDALTEMGHSAAVFHSPETFINSGAIYAADLLIVGKTRICRTQSEALQWAGTVRPNLRTLLLGYGLIELKGLCQLYEMKGDDTPQADVCDYLTEIRMALAPSASVRSQHSASVRKPGDKGSLLHLLQDISITISMQSLGCSL